MTPAVLRAARARLGLSREALGVALGVAGTTIYRWETGKAQPPGWPLVARAMRELEREMSEQRGATIARKLHIDTAALNALFSAAPVDGIDGRAVATMLRQVFHLDPVEPLGAELVAAGVLTEAEGAWLDDVED